MLRRGYGQQAVAAALGVSQATASRYLNARRPVPAARVAAIVELLGPARGLFQKAVPRG